MANSEDFKRYVYSLAVDTNKKVEAVNFNVVGDNFTGEFGVTDLQLQSGKQVTAHNPNVSEILEGQRFTVDENDFLRSVSNPLKYGVQPQVFENINNRFFNFTARGAEVIALPNVLHEDYTQDLVSSALDLSITAKQPFDLVRVSTNDGVLVPDRKYNGFEIPPLADHPLNYKYTREFYFGGGKAGDTLSLIASEFRASKNSSQLPLQQGTVTINGERLEGIRQRFMMAPYGTFRLRVEFYKRVTEELKWNDDYGENKKTVTYLKDVGIGFYGYAEFKQTKGRAKY